MFRFSVTLILASLCLPAQANLLRIDYDLRTVINASNWLLPDPPPDLVHASFTVDTASRPFSELELFTDANASTCVGHFRNTGFSVSDIAITAGAMSFGSIPVSSSGGFRGDNASGHCPGGFFGFIGFATDEVRFGGSVDFGGMTLAQLQSSDDVMGDLIGNMVGHHIDVGLTGDWGQLTLSGITGPVRNVPEPGTLALFAAALLGFVARNRHARKHRRPAAFA